MAKAIGLWPQLQSRSSSLDLTELSLSQNQCIVRTIDEYDCSGEYGPTLI